MDRLLAVMRRLRGPDGCPWDQVQTHESLRPYLLEEAGEAVDAISAGHAQELAGELGDVLLQVAFHAVIAEETQAFSYATIEDAIVEKLIRRHPHVFGEAVADTPEAVVDNWQRIKAEERAGQPEQHAAARVPQSLGALARAKAIHKALGLPKSNRAKLEDVVQRASDDATGVADVLEALVAWARGLDLDAEVLLRERLAVRVRGAGQP